ncbi:non-specific lipid transfer protein GPI-anchored 11-like [Musa acuminata AAA Group]|uniref:non-specific lipid transfer protein GPI-anchored 11-like n=1 Tax=Musa acuminata AAA Group TaxID=214697 RepID=UPI0031D635DA
MAGDRTGVWVLFLLLLWLTTAIMHGDGAPVAAPAPSPDCSSALLDLADCLSFVENGSTVAKPEGQCCSGLKKVVKEDVICLCEVLKQGPSLGVNLTKALTLPSACKLSTPPFSKCNISIAGVPAAAPAPTPSLGSPSSSSSSSSSVPTGAPSPSSPGKSNAALQLPSLGFLIGSMAVSLWLLCVSHGLEF